MNRRLALLAALAGALSLSGAAHAQRLGGSASADISLVRVFLALLLCVIVAVLAIFLIRQRYGGGRLPSMFPRLAPGGSRLRLVEIRRIGPQSDLCLVQCDETEFLVLIAPGGALLLRERQAAAIGDG